MLTTSLTYLDSLIHILLPRACLVCRTTTRMRHHLCEACANELPILSHSCRKCAQFLRGSERHHLICGMCLANPPPYDKVYALFPYQPPVPRLVAGLKFEEQLSHAHFFSYQLVYKINHLWYRDHSLPSLIIPMPLHTTRLRERGFNQAVEIAHPIGKALKIPLDHAVSRQKATLPQTTLTAKRRKRNVSKAFASTRRYDGLHVAIVDDVMTTGQTVTALARLIRRLGAKQVDVWCCARCDSRP